MVFIGVFDNVFWLNAPQSTKIRHKLPQANTCERMCLQNSNLLIIYPGSASFARTAAQIGARGRTVACIVRELSLAIMKHQKDAITFPHQ